MAEKYQLIRKVIQNSPDCETAVVLYETAEAVITWDGGKEPRDNRMYATYGQWQVVKRLEDPDATP